MKPRPLPSGRRQARRLSPPGRRDRPMPAAPVPPAASPDAPRRSAGKASQEFTRENTCKPIACERAGDGARRTRLGGGGRQPDAHRRPPAERIGGGLRQPAADASRHHGAARLPGPRQASGDQPQHRHPLRCRAADGGGRIGDRVRHRHGCGAAALRAGQRQRLHLQGRPVRLLRRHRLYPRRLQAAVQPGRQPGAGGQRRPPQTAG